MLRGLNRQINSAKCLPSNKKEREELIPPFLPKVFTRYRFSCPARRWQRGIATSWETQLEPRHQSLIISFSKPPQYLSLLLRCR